MFIYLSIRATPKWIGLSVWGNKKLWKLKWYYSDQMISTALISLDRWGEGSQAHQRAYILYTTINLNHSNHLCVFQSLRIYLVFQLWSVWFHPVCLAGVVNNLEAGGFFNEKVTKSCLFSTIHDAVLHCQSARSRRQKEDSDEVWHYVTH